MKLKTQTIISSITLLLGGIMMALMITYEDEPGGIPILIIVFSMIWKLIIKTKRDNSSAIG